MPPNIESYLKPLGLKTFKSKKATCQPDYPSRKNLPDMRLESNRLKTYKNWKNNAVTPKDLAQAGFYFLNTKYDAVKCAYCEIEICRWEADDDPLQEHARLAPDCPFVNEKGKKLKCLPSLFSTIRPGQDVRSMGVNNNTQLYSNLQDRLKTFIKWPKSSKQKPKELAEAGFLFSGVSDRTVCFECNGELQDWEDGDDAWEQHALWYPRCEYVEVSKGRDFIKEVQRKFGGNSEFDSKPRVIYTPCVDYLHRGPPPLTT